MKIKSIKKVTVHRQGWLKERFGECVAQIGAVTSFKLKSSIKDVFRAFDREGGNTEPRVPPVIEAICKALPNPPQGIGDKEYVFGYEDNDGMWVPGLLETNKVLQKFVEKYPREWSVVQMLLGGLSRSNTRHPCGFLISNEPIQNFIPLMTVGGVRVTGFQAAAVEAAGGLKVDFLTVRSLLDIGGAIKLIRETYAPDTAALAPDARIDFQYVDDEGIPFKTLDGKKVPVIRIVPFGDAEFDIWDLPPDDAVYTDICEGKVESVFQFDAGSARQGLRHFTPEPGKKPPLCSIEALSVFTALDRPGPLDAQVTDETGESHNMLVEYARRARGLKPVGALPILDKMLPESRGVLCFQEGLQRVFQEVGGTTGIEANNFRQRISKKKIVDVNKIDKPLFMKGAASKLGQEGADQLWDMMQTFGQYGFNASHAVCYVTISYACAWLKHHYPLEWWASVLTNADRKEIDEKFWRYCGKLIDLPDIQFSKRDFSIQNDRIRAPLSLLHGLGAKAHEQLLVSAPYASLEDFLKKIEDWRVAHPRQRKKVNKTTGETELVWAKGVTALNTTVIQNLIVSGAMDSLFPTVDESGSPMTIQQRLTSFVFAFRNVVGKRKINSIAAKFDLESPLVRLQLRKKVLPAFSARIFPLARATFPQRFRGGDLLTFVSEGDRLNTETGEFEHWVGDVRDTWRVVTGKQYEALLDVGPLEGDLKVSAVAYVVADRRFDYKQKSTGDQKTACELTLDVDGTRVSMVRWPSKDGLPANFSSTLTGAIVGCLLIRKAGETGFFLADVLILEPSLTAKTKAAEEDDEEESK
jgi:hypothetical protein